MKIREGRPRAIQIVNATEDIQNGGFTPQRSRVARSVRRITSLPFRSHDFHVNLYAHSVFNLTSQSGALMPTVMVRATTILGEFEQVQAELVGNAVILTDGKAGTVETVSLDELHGLRVSIRGHDGKWPISTIKLAQAPNPQSGLLPGVNRAAKATGVRVDRLAFE